MKRRNFLQSIIGGLSALFTIEAWPSAIPKTEAYTREDIEAASGFNEEMLGQPYPTEVDGLINKTLANDQNWRDTHLLNFDKQILDICDCRDYLYVLLEGGELWRAWKGGEYFGKPFLTWQMVHRYIWHAKKIFERSPGLLVGVEFNGGRLLYCGEYYVEA